MRFVVYLVVLAAVIYLAVWLIQFMTKRLSSADRVRKDTLAELRKNIIEVQGRVTAVMQYCENAVIVNDQDLTALNVLNLLNKKAST